jgi:hypothetical protein
VISRNQSEGIVLLRQKVVLAVLLVLLFPLGLLLSGGEVLFRRVV